VRKTSSTRSAVSIELRHVKNCDISAIWQKDTEGRTQSRGIYRASKHSDVTRGKNVWTDRHAVNVVATQVIWRQTSDETPTTIPKQGRQIDVCHVKIDDLRLIARYILQTVLDTFYRMLIKVIKDYAFYSDREWLLTASKPLIFLNLALTFLSSRRIHDKAGKVDQVGQFNNRVARRQMLFFNHLYPRTVSSHSFE